MCCVWQVVKTPTIISNKPVLWLLCYTIVENGNYRCAGRETWECMNYDTARKRQLNWLYHRYHHHHQTTIPSKLDQAKTSNLNSGGSRFVSWFRKLLPWTSFVSSQTSAFFLNYTMTASFQILSSSSHIYPSTPRYWKCCKIDCK